MADRGLTSVSSEPSYEGRHIVPEVIENRLGGYRFLPGLAFASQAVVAADDMAIEGARFPSALPLAEGFNAVRAAIEELDRPLQALCGFDLRLPAARRLDDFLSFNNEYLAQLRSWDLLVGESSPLARTNVAPIDSEIDAPALIGFSCTVPRTIERQHIRDFRSAGGAGRRYRTGRRDQARRDRPWSAHREARLRS